VGVRAVVRSVLSVASVLKSCQTVVRCHLLISLFKFKFDNLNINLIIRIQIRPFFTV
jgi:hypothetical protein